MFFSKIVFSKIIVGSGGGGEKVATVFIQSDKYSRIHVNN